MNVILRGSSHWHLWEDELINPIWIEQEEWNKVIYMIYEYPMDNHRPRGKDPGDLKKLDDLTVNR